MRPLGFPLASLGIRSFSRLRWAAKAIKPNSTGPTSSTSVDIKELFSIQPTKSDLKVLPRKKIIKPVLKPTTGLLKPNTLTPAERHNPRYSDKILPQNYTQKKPISKFTDISNRQKFMQIIPTKNITDKIELLGFGHVKRKYKQGITEKKETSWDPEYSFPRLQFFAGAEVPSSFPISELPEVAFLGRSNVGKSSLINILGDSTTARTGDKPGITQQINFYAAGNEFCLVDMPGYGFAFKSEDERARWRKLMENYIETRKSLRRLYMLIDARVGIKVNDREFFSYLDTTTAKYQVVLTKCDLILPHILARRYMVTVEDISAYTNAIQSVTLVSSHTGGGISQFRKEILFAVGSLKEKDYYKIMDKDKKITRKQK